MLIKLEPEDFVVTERTSWEPAESGPVAVYQLEKRKLDTFEAMRKVSAHTGIPLDRINYVGLKDRQAVTRQLISVEGQTRIRGQVPGLKLTYLGRSPAPLSQDQLRGNSFELVVRDLTENQVEKLPERLASVEAHGVIDYFDDQRFGTLTAGQDMPGREIVRGNFEQAVKLLLATAGKRDPVPEKRFKHLVQNVWGDWKQIARRWGNRRNKAMVNYLRKSPQDFAGALQRMPARERAIHVFAYQSLIWNRSVGLYLQALIPPHRRSSTPYAGGQLVWPNYGADDEFPQLVETFPLLDHTVEPADEQVRAAIEQALAEEELTIPRFKIEGIKGCFFRAVERPLRIWPEDLRISLAATEDDRRPGRFKVGVSFALPPGAYATLVLRRLFRDEPKRGDVADRERARRARTHAKRRDQKKKRQGKGKRKRKKRQ